MCTTVQINTAISHLPKIMGLVSHVLKLLWFDLVCFLFRVLMWHIFKLELYMFYMFIECFRFIFEPVLTVLFSTFLLTWLEILPRHWHTSLPLQFPAFYTTLELALFTLICFSLPLFLFFCLLSEWMDFVNCRDDLLKKNQKKTHTN